MAFTDCDLKAKHHPFLSTPHLLLLFPLRSQTPKYQHLHIRPHCSIFSITHTHLHSDIAHPRRKETRPKCLMLWCQGDSATAKAETDVPHSDSISPFLLKYTGEEWHSK